MNHRVASSNLIKNFVTFSSSVSLIMLDREFESRNWNSKNSCNCLSYAITNIFWKKIFLFSIHFLIWKKLCSIWGSITFSFTLEVNFKFQIQMNRIVTSSNLIKNFVSFSSSVSLIMLDREFESRNWNYKNSCNCLSYAITNIFWKKSFYSLFIF